MKRIEIPSMGEGQQIWFNIGRLKRVESILKKPIHEVANEMVGLNITNLVVLLQVGMSQNGFKSEQYYEEKLQEALDEGVPIEEVYQAVLKALVGCGVLGKAAYYNIFPDESDEEAEKN